MDDRTGPDPPPDTSIPPDALSPPDTPTPPEASQTTRNDGAERDNAADDAADGVAAADEDAESSGPLARARAVGAEAVGVVADAVLDAL